MTPKRDKRYLAFIEKLIQARKDVGLTQAAVAQRLGRSQSFVAKCEMGTRRVDFIELLVFAEIYRKPLQFFSPKSEPRKP